MKKRSIITIIAGVAILTAGAMSVTVTAQDEYKLIRRFGKVERVISSPGTSLKVPFLETAATLPKQTLLYDLSPSDV